MQFGQVVVALSPLLDRLVNRTRVFLNLRQSLTETNHSYLCQFFVEPQPPGSNLFRRRMDSIQSTIWASTHSSWSAIEPDIHPNPSKSKSNALRWPPLYQANRKPCGSTIWHGPQIRSMPYPNVCHMILSILLLPHCGRLQEMVVLRIFDICDFYWELRGLPGGTAGPCVLI
jgi:hypothetical protein